MSATSSASIDIMEKQDVFKEKILPILNYVGAIGALITSISYIILVIVLIFGFKAEKVLHTTVFAIVNAGVGFIIMQFLKYQGITFAENIEENKKLIDQYHSTKTKDKKPHSLGYYWFTSVVKDIFIKCISVGITTVGLIYIVIQGSKDFNLIWLAIVNLLMFISFGLLALVKAYKYFNSTYIEYIKEQLQEGENENGSKENLS